MSEASQILDEETTEQVAELTALQARLRTTRRLLEVEPSEVLSNARRAFGITAFTRRFTPLVVAASVFVAILYLFPAEVRSFFERAPSSVSNGEILACIAGLAVALVMLVNYRRTVSRERDIRRLRAIEDEITLHLEDRSRTLKTDRDRAIDDEIENHVRAGSLSRGNHG